MLTHGLDPRGGFAVSIALFVGVFSQVNPAYFTRLPDWMHMVTSDMLTVSLVIAIGLTLLFRIGIRRNDAEAWDATDAAHAELSAFLEREGKAWKLDPSVVARAKAAAASLVDRLKAGGYLTSPVAITASFDTLELTVQLVYRGAAPPMEHHRFLHPAAHEEAATVIGLTGYALSTGADRTSVSMKNDEVTLRLGFAA